MLINIAFYICVGQKLHDWSTFRNYMQITLHIVKNRENYVRNIMAPYIQYYNLICAHVYQYYNLNMALPTGDIPLIKICLKKNMIHKQSLVYLPEHICQKLKPLQHEYCVRRAINFSRAHRQIDTQRIYYVFASGNRENIDKCVRRGFRVSSYIFYARDALLCSKYNVQYFTPDHDYFVCMNTLDIAKKYITDQYSIHAICGACASGNLPVLEYLLQYNKYIECGMRTAIYFNRYEIVCRLQEYIYNAEVANYLRHRRELPFLTNFNQN